MGVETLMLVAAGASAAGAIYTGIQNKEAADTNAEILRRQGEQEKDAAVAQAEKIRKAARAQAGAAKAALAASGVAIGEGTAVRINEQILEDAEKDAYSTILTGTRRQSAANDEAGFLRSQGNSAMTGSVLSAGATAAGGWARYKKG